MEEEHVGKMSMKHANHNNESNHRHRRVELVLHMGVSSLSSTINWPTNCCAHTHAHTDSQRENEGKQQQKANLRLLVTLLVLRPFRSCLSAPMQASRRSCCRSRSRCLRCAGLRCVVCYTNFVFNCDVDGAAKRHC